MKRFQLIIIATFMLILFSCAKRTQVIDFEYSESVSTPIIKALISNNEYRFLLDTGCPVNELKSSGVEKRFGSIERMENILNQEKEKYNLKDGYLKVDLSNIRISSKRYYSKEFILRLHETENNDGIISWKFFGNPDSMIINYTAKKLVLNTKEHIKSENIIDFYIGENNGLIIFPIYIDGFKREAVLDTGANTKNEKILISPEDIRISNIRIGNIVYDNIESMYFKNEKLDFKCQDKDALHSILRNYYIISNAFFSDGKIEIDFKNKQLIIAK